MDVPLEALQRRGGVAAVSFGADLDGDGVNDKITRQTDERGGLNVALGRIEEGTFGGTVLEFSDEEVFVGVGRCEPPRVVDLDGDGLDELLLEPFGGDDARARTVQLAGVRP